MVPAVIEKDKENAILLSLTREISLIRDKDDLLTVIHRHLKTLFRFNDAAIGVIDKETGDQRLLVTDPESKRRAHEDYTTITTDTYPYHDGIFDVTLASEQPLIFQLEKIMARGKVPPYMQFAYDTGVREFIAVSLRTGREKTGVFYLSSEQEGTFTSYHLNLLQGIAPQLSTVVSGILVYEELLKYKQQLEEENSYLLREIGGAHEFKELIGDAPAIREVFHLVSRVADSRSTVLLLGETGTGKELIARAIHQGSDRADKLMIKVNCAALPASLIESELFGHEKGSFTGATERKLGKFELANNGTLFLDEIGELPLDLQVKLLRVLQEREIERIGGRGAIPVDVRIIAATNRNIEKEAAEGRFRNDLYYRLNVFPIVVPPLRDRKEDISLLTEYFIERFAKYAGKKVTGISTRVKQAMMSYDWPGNVRELEHLIERSILLTTGNILNEIHLPSMDSAPTNTPRQDHFKTLIENEREHIVSALKRCNGKISGPGGVAELLDIHVSTLNARIRKLGIRKDKAYRSKA